jgi:hypothetical protein
MGNVVVETQRSTQIWQCFAFCKIGKNVGFRGQFAPQESLAAHVRFTPKADIETDRLAIFAAIRRSSFLVSSLAADRRPGSSSK